MPGYDGTGPVGRGPNGRGLGPCGAGGGGLGNRRFLGLGLGRRGGRGRLWWNQTDVAEPPISASSEREWLKRQRDFIDSRLKSLDEE
jgi:hypothetical protein